MESPSLAAKRLQIGSALRDDAIYAERDADALLFDALRAGELCYVLAPRQMGKSSLKVKTAAKLRTTGVEVALIDLTMIGSRRATANAWFSALLSEISACIGLGIAQESASGAGLPVQVWTRQITMLAKAMIRPAVVFIDEIDSAKALDFGDDFLLSIRALHNARAVEPALDNITFCVLGASPPAEILRDDSRTPFNVGRRVPLEDFTREQTEVFAGAIEAAGGDRSLLDRIFYWVRGHPYMTQLVIAKLAGARSDVDEIVRTELLDKSVYDLNMAPIETAFERDAPTIAIAGMLETYGAILRGGRVVVEHNSAAHAGVVSIGLARQDGRWLVSRNRVLATVFDSDWVQMKQRERFIAQPLALWLANGKNAKYLPSGIALIDAHHWAIERDDLLPIEREFLTKASAVFHNSARRKGLLTVAIIVLLAMSAVGMGMLYARARASARAASSANAQLTRLEHEEKAAIQTLNDRVAKETEIATGSAREAASLRAKVADAASQRAKVELLFAANQELANSNRALKQLVSGASADEVTHSYIDRVTEDRDQLQRENASLQASLGTLKSANKDLQVQVNRCFSGIK